MTIQHQFQLHSRHTLSELPRWIIGCNPTWHMMMQHSKCLAYAETIDTTDMLIHAVCRLRTRSWGMCVCQCSVWQQLGTSSMSGRC